MSMIMFKIKKFFLNLHYNTEEKRKLPIYKISFLDLQKKYNVIDDYTYDLEITRIHNSSKSENDIKIGDLEIMLKYNKIDIIEYCKNKIDLLNKPWVAIKTNYDDNNNPDNLEIEVIYNQTFIKKMKNRGLPGDNDEEVVEQWLKLFLIANLEDEDFSLLNEQNQQEYYTRTKLNDNSTFII